MDKVNNLQIEYQMSGRGSVTDPNYQPGIGQVTITFMTPVLLPVIDRDLLQSVLENYLEVQTLLMNKKPPTEFDKVK